MTGEPIAGDSIPRGHDAVRVFEGASAVRLRGRLRARTHQDPATGVPLRRKAPAMNDDEVWAAIDSERRRTADLLGQLSDDEWAQPSLCDGWTVRDVAAHLTLQQLTVGDCVRMVLRHPGPLNSMICAAARRRATLPTDRLIADLRATIGSRRRNVGLTSLEPLSDILVHGQDIAIPLHRDLEMPVTAAAAAATRVWSFGGRGKARVFRSLPLRGYRLTATDVEWSAGEGPEIRGPISAILLLLTGRRVALPLVSGPGADELRARLPAG